jgi:hypothetical protein
LKEQVETVDLDEKQLKEVTRLRATFLMVLLTTERSADGWGYRLFNIELMNGKRK